MENTENPTTNEEQWLVQLFDVLMAARTLLAVKASPRNPFVKQIGKGSLTEEGAFIQLATVVERARDIVNALDEAERERMRAEMDAIDAEEDAFDAEE